MRRDWTFPAVILMCYVAGLAIAELVEHGAWVHAVLLGVGGLGLALAVTFERVRR